MTEVGNQGVCQKGWPDFSVEFFREEKGVLKLQVGIRNGPYRMRSTFKYVRGEELDEFGKASWGLAAVRIGREKLGVSPTADDMALFRVPKKGVKKPKKVRVCCLRRMY